MATYIEIGLFFMHKSYITNEDTFFKKNDLSNKSSRVRNFNYFHVF